MDTRVKMLSSELPIGTRVVFKREFNPREKIFGIIVAGARPGNKRRLQIVQGNGTWIGDMASVETYKPNWEELTLSPRKITCADNVIILENEYSQPRVRYYFAEIFNDRADYTGVYPE